MGRTYAGILALLAFLVQVARGVIHGRSAEATLWAACIALAVLAAIGWIIGHLAGWIVDESVREAMRAAMRAQQEGDDAAQGAPS